MYVVGAYVVSTLTGTRFMDFVNSRIFTPLGMSSSTYSIDAALQTGRFSETWTSFGRRIPPWIEEEYVDLLAGPAGVISSAEDMARPRYLGVPNILTHFSTGPLRQDDSEWWFLPRYEFDSHPTQSV